MDSIPGARRHSLDRRRRGLQHPRSGREELPASRRGGFPNHLRSAYIGGVEGGELVMRRGLRKNDEAAIGPRSRQPARELDGENLRAAVLAAGQDRCEIDGNCRGL